MLILHVVAALLLLGPVTVAVSTFHVRAREAHNGNNLARGSVRTLFTITNTYGLISLIVPLLGVGLLLSNMSYLREGRFHASILLSVIAWGILFFLIVPRWGCPMMTMACLARSTLAKQRLKTGTRRCHSSQCLAASSLHCGSSSPYLW